MSIKFVCVCGKHLRARDEMARRRAVCPGCGRPVGVPSLEPTHPGTDAAPLTPEERLRRARQRGTAADADSETEGPPHPPARSGTTPDDKLGRAILALLAIRHIPRRQRQRPLEACWYDYLLYPFHDWRLWLGPVTCLMIVTGMGLLIGPRLLTEESFGGFARGAVLAGGLPGFVAVVYLCHFLGRVLRSATNGDGSAERGSGLTPGGALKGAAVWLACFLAGPVVPAAVVVVYWLQCGDLGVVDWLILAELLVLTVGYGLAVLAAVAERGRLRDANPLRVIDLVHRLGFRAAVVAVIGSALVLGHALLAGVAAEQLHRTWAVGVLLWAVCWYSGLFWAAFLFRLLGVWCYRSRAG